MPTSHIALHQEGRQERVNRLLFDIKLCLCYKLSGKELEIFFFETHYPHASLSPDVNSVKAL